jgi:hypothetical protein
MQFKAPQFIEMETKLIGQFTFKQAIYIGGAGGMEYILFKFLPVILALPIGIAVAVFAYMLAFLPKEKYGKPFIEIAEAAFKYLIKSRLYTWKRQKTRPEIESEETKPKVPPTLLVPSVSEGKLENISKELEVGKKELEERESEEPMI